MNRKRLPAAHRDAEFLKFRLWIRSFREMHRSRNFKLACPFFSRVTNTSAKRRHWSRWDPIPGSYVSILHQRRHPPFSWSSVFSTPGPMATPSAAVSAERPGNTIELLIHLVASFKDEAVATGRSTQLHGSAAHRSYEDCAMRLHPLVHALFFEVSRRVTRPVAQPSFSQNAFFREARSSKGNRKKKNTGRSVRK